MAEDKTSFILYSDLIHTVRKMPKDKAGELFLTILSYVNDENPVVEDMVVDLVFEPIKRQLKRDLKAWEYELTRKSDGGKKGMESRWGKKDKSVITKDNSVKQVITPITVNVNGTVNGNGNVNGTVNAKKNKFKDSAIEYVAKTPQPEYVLCLDFWLKEFHPGWTFSSAKGKALKSIIKKIKYSLKENSMEVTEVLILDSFRIICKKLPQFFKNKDLEILDSKFNEIVTEIKTPTKNGKQPVDQASLASEAIALSDRDREQRNAAKS